MSSPTCNESKLPSTPPSTKTPEDGEESLLLTPITAELRKPTPDKSTKKRKDTESDSSVSLPVSNVEVASKKTDGKFLIISLF